MPSFYKPQPNAFKNTFCEFHEIDLEAISNLKVQFESQSGSKYYYSNEGMYRLSNHWGRLANSKWRLFAREPQTTSKFKLGFAKWEHFYVDNATEKLYYLEADFEKNTITYQHKNNPNYSGTEILRTSLATTKRIKQARNILILTNWANYFLDHNIEDLRKKIVHQLIFTDKSLEEIKREVSL